MSYGNVLEFWLPEEYSNIWVVGLHGQTWGLPSPAISWEHMYIGCPSYQKYWSCFLCQLYVSLRIRYLSSLLGRSHIRSYLISYFLLGLNAYIISKTIQFIVSTVELSTHNIKIIRVSCKCIYLNADSLYLPYLCLIIKFYLFYPGIISCILLLFYVFIWS